MQKLIFLINLSVCLPLPLYASNVSHCPPLIFTLFFFNATSTSPRADPLLPLHHSMHRLVPFFSQFHIALCYHFHIFALSLPYADATSCTVLLTSSHCPSHTYISRRFFPRIAPFLSHAVADPLHLAEPSPIECSAVLSLHA